MSTGSRRLVFWFAAVCFGMGHGSVAQQPVEPSAQTTQPSAQATEPYVLHVYTNLIQLPTLVLTEDLKPVPPVPKDRFDLRIDSGPAFHPTGLRREGNDPISLAILLDVSGDQDELIGAFAASFPLLAPQYLHPQDHVSIFALDCKMMRSLNDVPADPAVLRRGVDAVLQSPGLHGNKRHGACGRALILRNALAQTIHTLSDVPGRRVLLVIADGHDGGSSLAWPEVEQYAASNGVAVFGFRDLIGNAALPMGFAGPRGRTTLNGTMNVEDPFQETCDSSGGLLVSTTRFQMNKELMQWMNNLRDRYIVEFPRPDDTVPGLHNIQISIARTRYLAHATGVSVSLPDPGEKNNPNTVPVSKSPATFGKRRPLQPTH